MMDLINRTSLKDRASEYCLSKMNTEDSAKLLMKSQLLITWIR